MEISKNDAKQTKIVENTFFFRNYLNYLHYYIY